MDEEMVSKYIKKEYRKQAFKVMLAVYGTIVAVVAVLCIVGVIANGTVRYQGYESVITIVTELIFFASIASIVIVSRFQVEGVERTFLSFRVNRRISLEARKDNVLIHAGIFSLLITMGDMLGKSIIWSERNINGSYVVAFFVFTVLFYLLFIATVVFFIEALSSKVIVMLIIPYVAVAWGCIASPHLTALLIIDSVTYTPVLCVVMLLLCVSSFYILQYRMMRRDYKMWGGDYE